MGSYYNKKHIGNDGIFSVYSFNGNKIVTTAGGGAIVTKNKNYAKKIQHLAFTDKVKIIKSYVPEKVKLYIEKNLLAAISFQESQWDPKAKSNMGVRGMMMVTLETAALVGVEKRLNPEQNIKGGAKYFSMLQNKNKIGPSEADKLSIVLASYNLGPTNIIKIAGQIDSNIENVTWEDIKEKLKVTTGEDLNMMDNGSYSRAQQAIDYVDRVKSYYQLISAHACVNPKDQLTFF